MRHIGCLLEMDWELGLDWERCGENVLLGLKNISYINIFILELKKR